MHVWLRLLIPGFIASDIFSQNSQTNMLVITDYHANGALHDFLKRSETPLQPLQVRVPH